MDEFTVIISFEPQCKFVSMNTCDPPYIITSFFVGLLSQLPYFYIFSKLLKQSKVHLKSELTPGVFFCITHATSYIVQIIYNFSFYFYGHRLYATFTTKIYSTFQDLLQLSIISYLISVTSILFLLKIKYSKIIHYTALSQKYLLLVLLSVKFFLQYFELSEDIENAFFYESGIVESILKKYELFIIIFTFWIIAYIVLFSDTKKFIPENLINKLKIALFLIPLTYFITITIKAINESMYFRRLAYINMNLYGWMKAILYTFHINIYHYVILWIIYMFSLSDTHNEESDSVSTLDISII